MDQDSSKEVAKQSITVASRPLEVALPPSTSAEDLELRDASATTQIHASKPPETTTSSAQIETPATDRSVANDRQLENERKDEASQIEDNAPRKKSFSVFGTLRRLSTTNIKNERQEPTPQSATKPEFITPISPTEQFGMQRTSTMSTTSSKRSTGSLFRSIRAALKFSSKSAPNSPMNRSITSARSPITPISPMSPLSGRANPDELRRPARTSTKLSDKSFSPTSRRDTFRRQEPERKVYTMPTPLRSASTWSPESSNPVLSTNPNAKLYTVWPKYPIIDTQIKEVQELLEGLLASDKKAIETSREPGSQLVVHYWKAPLTAEQAEVVKSNKMVSSIQLSKLDYDMSDMF